MPYTVKKSGSQYCVFKKGGGNPIKGGCHKSKKDADKHRDALNINVHSMSGAIASVIATDALGSTAIEALTDNPPQLTTVRDVPIMETGIEYPLSTGPSTFIPDDLADAVKAQDDPAIKQPRIWLGHPDDPRIHGKRYDGGIPSGEPAVGRVMNMRLENQGHTIVGDLEGTPIWIARIMASAFPSRSIEGSRNVETVTGRKYRLVISGLALLGVVWPGVSTLDDIASLYTEDGPDNVEVIEATKERPLTVIAGTLNGQATIEDLRRQYYDSLGTDQYGWWVRAIYVNPAEVIIQDDETNDLFSQSWEETDGDFKFGSPVKKKIKYVNASDGAIVASAVEADDSREHAALYASREESRPEDKDEDEGGLEIQLTIDDFIEISIPKEVAQ